MHPTDPVWAPVEGISLDLYAWITAALITEGISDTDAIDTFVHTHFGTPPGAWAGVRAEWVARMGHHRAVRARYSTAFADAFTAQRAS